MIAVDNVTMRFGSRILFEEVTTTFMAGRRYAISGPNGAGKSTFMKILTGEQEPTRPETLHAQNASAFCARTSLPSISFG